MSYITGKIKQVLFQNNNTNFVVALFRLADKSEDLITEKKTMKVIGVFPDLKLETNIKIEGSLADDPKYGERFKSDSYEYIMPTKEDDIVDFLSSDFIKGCGRKTAENIVNVLGSDALNKIKEDINVLDKVEGINASRKTKIYASLKEYNATTDLIMKIKALGFTIEESGRIYNKYKNDTEMIIENNIYLLNDVIDFKRLDIIFLNNNEDEFDKRRVKALIIEAMKYISRDKGSIYYENAEVFSTMNRLYNLNISYELYLDYLSELERDFEVVIKEDICYLQKNFEDEIIIAEHLKKIDAKEPKKIELDEKIEKLEKKLNIIYNDEQKRAIKTALNNNITIISGGPGTGKTTIIKAIVNLYVEQMRYTPLEANEQIALLAPTGRASKKMSTATGYKASTIHRYLKWNKDTDEFMINEDNKNFQRLIIVDEASMIDNNLFASLLKGIHSYVKLILVGDAFQLPSVGPGYLLNDLITSDLFNYVPLNFIYRQSENSYIPYLAKEIKNKDLQEDFINKKDDYNFIACENNQINDLVRQIIEEGIKKGYDENSLQVLAPIYRGENGIDNLNNMLRGIFNPKSADYIIYGDIEYRVGDKVLQLVNDADNNVFNGDIGFIERIYYQNGSEMITIDFDGNIVNLAKKDLKNIKHAYAVTIHKSQGSEFDHVIMPISSYYGAMLYNKLLYTGVSRAKKSLILIGSPKYFWNGVLNDYGNNRNTTLKERLNEVFLTD